MEEEYKIKIINLLDTIENKIPDTEHLKIKNICKETFDGEIFLDQELNIFYCYLENIIKHF